MKKQFNDTQEESQVQDEQPGFLSSLANQVHHKSFRSELLSWAIGGFLYALIFVLLDIVFEDRYFYLKVGLATIGFILSLSPSLSKKREHQLAGKAVKGQKVFWLYLIRVGFSSGGAFAASYYLIDRMGLAPSFMAIVIALCLILGNIALSFIDYPVLLYIVFGLMTTVVSILSFNGMNFILYGEVTGGGDAFGWLIPKLVSWILAVLFAYLTNRRLVFDASGNFWHEMLKFFIARIASGFLVEFCGLFVLENLLGIARDISNLLISLIVVVVNYVFSKLFVFVKEK